LSEDSKATVGDALSVSLRIRERAAHIDGIDGNVLAGRAAVRP